VNFKKKKQEEEPAKNDETDSQQTRADVREKVE